MKRFRAVVFYVNKNNNSKEIKEIIEANALNQKDFETYLKKKEFNINEDCVSIMEI